MKTNIEKAAEYNFPKTNTFYKLRQDGFIKGANWASSESSKDYDIWKRYYSAIFISVKFMGIWWEFWSEYRTLGDDSMELFREVKNKYIKKLKNRDFRMRLHYPDDIRYIKNKKI